MWKKHNFYILLLVLLLLPSVSGLFHSGFFPMHDDEQVGRLFDMDQSLKAGQIPPRLIQNLGFGYDYPLFNFYPPFVYYVAEVFVLLGFSYIVSIKLMIALGFLLSALFIYLFVKEYSGRFGGLVAAASYTYSPYHAIDVYVRGALPEFWSFVFLPALFWAYVRLQRTRKFVYVLLSGLFIALFLLTHNLIAMMAAPFIGIFLLYLLVISSQRIALIIQIVISGVIGLGLSAYFWLPAIIERKDTMVELLTGELASYLLHFVYVPQFWNSVWGYGGSTFGINDGLSFQVGKIHLLLVCFLFCVAIILWVLKKKFNKVIFLFLFLFTLSLFMQTYYSQFIWDLIQPFWYIQFPWRYLVLSAFFASTVAGLCFIFIRSLKTQIFLTGILIILFILINKSYFQPALYLSTVTDNSYTDTHVLRWKTSSLSFEYVPKGIKIKKSTLGNTIVDIAEDQIAKNSYTVLTKGLRVTPIQDVPHKKIFTVSTPQAAFLQLNTFSFPGWEIALDGKKVPFNDKNKFKLITVAIPPGTHRLSAEFTRTSTRLVADTISLMMGILITIALILLLRYPHALAFFTVKKFGKK